MKGIPSPLRFPSGILLMAFIVLLIGGMLPVRPLLAGEIDQDVDNTLEEFADGLFQRAALSDLVVTSGDLVGDVAGAIQLAPAGLNTRWSQSSYPLPVDPGLMATGAAVIGDRIYVIGGLKSSGVSLAPTAEVWSAQMNKDNGTLIAPAEGQSAWQAEPVLPEVVSADGQAALAPVSSPAVASVDNGNGSGYLYVIGGIAGAGVVDYSSYAVRVGVVGANGRVSSWVEGARLPDTVDGLAGASAVSYSISGKTFVYLIGGFQREAFKAEKGSKKVFYAQVGAGGKLFKPGNPSEEGWDELGDVPLVAPNKSNEGVWYASVVADSFAAADGSSQHALYLVGGQRVPGSSPEYSPDVYRAAIKSDGTLEWSVGRVATLPQPLSKHGGVQYNGNFYLTGGQRGSSNTPDDRVLATFVQDDLSLWKPDGSQVNFQESGTITDQRMRHSAVLVQGNNNAAFIYLIGGQLPDISGKTELTNGVIYAQVGGSKDYNDVGYAPDGWYYSLPYKINFDRAELSEVRWSTQIDRGKGQDVEMSYRTADAPNCETAQWRGWESLDSLPADAGYVSGDGKNSLKIETPQTRCFQYRARLKRGSELRSSPALLRVSITIFRPGYPDLHVTQITDRRGDDNRQLTGLDIIVTNQKGPPNTDTNPVLSLAEVGIGGFFVDLCIFGPGEQVQIPESPAVQKPPQCTKVFAQVSGSYMGVGATYNLSSLSTQWYNGDDTVMAYQDLKNYFTKVGVYTVVVVTDSENGVDEGPNGGENNNVSEQFQVTVYPVEEPAWEPGQPVEDDWTPSVEPEPEPPVNPPGDGPVYLPVIIK